MAHPMTSKKKARIASIVFFLIFLVFLIIMNEWWPWIMLAIGLPLAFRQYLVGRGYDMLITLLVFVGAFITAQFDIDWSILLPAIFTLGGFYLLVREFFGSDGVYALLKSALSLR